MATYNLKDLKRYNQGGFVLDITNIADGDIVNGLYDYIYENISNGKYLIISHHITSEAGNVYYLDVPYVRVDASDIFFQTEVDISSESYRSITISNEDEITIEEL